jgi:hypothetical protein
LIVFTYRNSMVDLAIRWKDTSIIDAFFNTQDEARSAVLKMREEIISASFEDWLPVHIERVDLAPIVGRDFMTLLNKGIGPFVLTCEIVETIN